MGRAARGRLGAGSCGAPFPVDFGHDLSLVLCGGRGGQGTGSGSAADAPLGRRAVAPSSSRTPSWIYMESSFVRELTLAQYTNYNKNFCSCLD